MINNSAIHLSRFKKRNLLILFELFLFLIIGFLGYKIYKIKRNVMGTQVVRINKDNLQFDTENKQLKYYYEAKPNSTENWNPDWLEQEVDNSINADTLNERFDYSIDKKSNIYRIITIGDSFTYGQYVITERNYTEILEDILNKKITCDGIKNFEIINLGVDGYDIAYSTERFIKRGIKYNPDLVIWLLNEFNFDKINELLLPQMIKLTGTPDFVIKNGTLRYYRLVLAEKQAYKGKSNDFFVSYQKKALDRFRDNYKGRLLLLSLSPYKKFETLINDFVISNQNYIYFDKLLEDYWNNSSYRFLDGHPNEKGHQKIAQNIFDYLYNNYLGKCKIKKD